ncbi:malto-oligosyltrehalose trehalohydrolase [Olivibacter sp. XZL3]|uniref:malto-oligosyltrehalose trehalohydrolase n=1 Tax=Olivibacter sp. XZL3 TaxID=1735116 RepID=UPI0010663023|nr:malto-oligosyltrehalose trehalohydrolase [Olivibacter sp. XZL3]
MSQLHSFFSGKAFGIHVESGKATIGVWAPNSKHVRLVTNAGTQIELEKRSLGFWSAETNKINEGDLYKVLLDDKQPMPDPASRFQPQGVHGYSQVVNLNKHSWTDLEWRNLPLESYIIYELHIGTFTPAGTFDAVVEKLDYLVDLGINAIEIMPVAQFPGERNWGYDGVFPFAVQASYGGPAALQSLVEACHNKGIAVVLDVVYNHLGPEGNYLESYGPFFTDKYHTPWGKAVNVDDAYCDGVRTFILENMLMWFRDFHIDALRLDAVHAIKDYSAEHILAAMRMKLDELSDSSGRPYYLIGECDLNDARYISPVEKGGYGLHAQWIDEFHHALRVSAGEPRNGYYSDFEPLVHLAKSFTDAYVYDGVYSPHRKKIFGNSASIAEGKQFVVFSQNHDQVGNRMLGERSSVLYSEGLQRVMAAAVLAAPYLPFLFMGEEYAEKQPFQYFVSHTDEELAEAVRKGRKQEFKDFHGGDDTPDPMAVSTFERSKLNWSLIEQPAHRETFQLYKQLITLRKTHSAWRHLDRSRVEIHVWKEEQVLLLHRWDEEESLFFYFNFSDQRQERTASFSTDRALKIFDTSDTRFLAENFTLPADPVLKLAPQSASIYQLLTQ